MNAGREYLTEPPCIDSSEGGSNRIISWASAYLDPQTSTFKFSADNMNNKYSAAHYVPRPVVSFFVVSTTIRKASVNQGPHMVTRGWMEALETPPIIWRQGVSISAKMKTMEAVSRLARATHEHCAAFFPSNKS